MMQIDNYYQILEVEEDASLAEIKSSFRNLAKKYHPDRNKSSMSAQQFARIMEAYKVLSDEHKRMVFDTKYGYGLQQRIKDVKNNQPVVPRNSVRYQSNMSRTKMHDNTNITYIVIMILVYLFLIIFSYIVF